MDNSLPFTTRIYIEIGDDPIQYDPDRAPSYRVFYHYKGEMNCAYAYKREEDLNTPGKIGAIMLIPNGSSKDVVNINSFDECTGCGCRASGEHIEHMLAIIESMRQRLVEGEKLREDIISGAIKPEGEES